MHAIRAHYAVPGTLYPIPCDNSTINLAPMRSLSLLLLFALALCSNTIVAQDTLHVQDSIRVQLYGTVIDEVTQQPVFETLVEWYNSAGKRQAVTQTNDEGRYALFVWAGEPIEIRITENGYEDFAETLPAFEAGESAREFVLRLVPK
jgi:hypothetical protein